MNNNTVVFPCKWLQTCLMCCCETSVHSLSSCTRVCLSLSPLIIFFGPQQVCVIAALIPGLESHLVTSELIESLPSVPLQALSKSILALIVQSTLLVKQGAG